MGSTGTHVVGRGLAYWPTGLCGLTDCQGEGNEGNEGNVVNRDVGQD
jgi:hypothetical protein